MSPAVREGKVEMTEAARSEGLRVATLLSAWIHKRKRTVRDVERTLGWTHKTLWNALNGKTPLRFSHVAAVAEALGFGLAAFYRELADEIEREEPPEHPTLPIRERTQTARLSTEERDDILREVRDLLRRVESGGEQ